MCGIFGMISRSRGREAHSVTGHVLQGIDRLQMRGYDGCGIAYFTPAGIRIVKTAEKIGELRTQLGQVPPYSDLAIGHNRWATHGERSTANSHPHGDETVAITHNGIIRNFFELYEELAKERLYPVSGTDSEVLALLIKQALRRGAASLEDAVAYAVSRVEGDYAFVAISREHPDSLVGAAHGMPLIVGVGPAYLSFASQELALAEHATQVRRLGDGDIATLSRQDGFTIRGKTPMEVSTGMRPPSVAAEAADKGPFQWFTQKEIYEQPSCIMEALRGRVDATTGAVTFAELSSPELVERLRGASAITFLACGTSLNACRTVAPLVRRTLNIPVATIVASEYVPEGHTPDPQHLVIVVSQSGETRDILAPLGHIYKAGATVIALLNAEGSAMEQFATAVVYVRAGAEIGVASTKAFTSQVSVLTALALHLANLRAPTGSPYRAELARELAAIPQKVRAALKKDGELYRIAHECAHNTRALFIGRGIGASLAEESALKLLELAGVDAHARPAAEFKHGPIRLVKRGTPVFGFVIPDGLEERMLSNLEEAKARGAVIYVFDMTGSARVRAVAKRVVSLEATSPEVAAIVMAVLLQLLSVAWTTILGHNVDQPDNLAKTVVVE